ncbi:MAG TPA: cation:dicarboxylase symporter family transporter [Chlamydiales bacterium]|nr:cation:dicarboxylase symporter family transporter [Chlamydiales bacterium]
MKASIGYQVLIAVVLGILAGLFFGPLTNLLAPIGVIYTMLLQMAVLPYICFSLIHGLGSMTPQIGKKLLKSGWPYLLTLWVLIFAVIALLSQLIPSPIAPLVKASGEEGFFAKNFLTYLIPGNPFYDIANNIVPAVAIFGLIGGIALMHVEKKEPLIGVLERINQTIEKILYWLGVLSPIAAFVYISVAFGTIYLQDVYKLGIFVSAFIFTTLFITFCLLPILLSNLTPLTYREVLKAFRFVCLLPFVTGLSTAALPFLNSYLKKLSHKHQTHEKFRETSQTILPIAYSFGHIGNAMTLFFIVFLSYYYRHPFSLFEKGLLSILTIPLSIGSSTTNFNSILFLIQQLGFPTGAAEFFLEIKSVTFNFQVLLSIAGVFTLIILTIYSYYGLLRFKWRRLITQMGASTALFIILVFSLRPVIHLKDNYQSLYLDLTMAGAIEEPLVPSKILPVGDTGTPRVFEEADTLHQIIATKVLKVGYNTDSTPYCYTNNRNELVGFDIAYAYRLARDLDCRLEFVHLDFDTIGEDLTKGAYDIGMSSILIDDQRILHMDFSHPYSEEDNVLIVPASKKGKFIHLKDVMKMKNLKIAAGGANAATARRNFPNATVLETTEMDPMLLNEKVDAVLWAKTSAFIWCISEPNFVTIDYGGQLGRTYFAYPVRQHSLEFRFFLDSWLTLKEQSGFKKQMQSYWIDGVPLKTRPPRWSLLRNVFHLIN